MSEIAIELLHRADVERLEPLWLELRAHHLAVSPSALPVPFEAVVSWAHRRAKYLEALSHPSAFGLTASRDSELVGYAMVSIHGAGALGDTWEAGEQVAELETLIVSSSQRTLGVGAELLRRVEDEVRARAIHELIIGTVATNDQALAFYEHRGYQPYLTYLYARLDGPSTPGANDAAGPAVAAEPLAAATLPPVAGAGRTDQPQRGLL